MSGLRREEVAVLAGVSVDYYTKLGRGKIRGASNSVLNAIARALKLSDVEREHLFSLARPTTTIPAANHAITMSSLRSRSKSLWYKAHRRHSALGWIITREAVRRASRR